MAKRLFDVALTLLVAPFALVAALLTATVLAIELRGNPFFVQERVGLYGEPFRMYKLRTMRHAQPGEERPRVVADWGSYVFAPEAEPNPRIRRWGAFARKYSLDELPNLINVLKGEMSLVGPRPEIPEIVAQYPPEYRRRHEVRPGIAGLAQANGRSDLPYAEIAAYDLRYVDSHSLVTDLRILGKTAFLAVKGRGAR